MLDEVAVREMLAGVELELGDEKKKTAEANEAAAAWRKWGPLGIAATAIVAFVSGFLVSR